MLFIKILVGLFALTFGIVNRRIDAKHRKRKAYVPGDEWAYYSRLSKEGCREGRFMVLSAWVGIGVIIASLAYLASMLLTR